MAEVPQEDARAQRWLILAMLFAARTAMAFQFQSIAALGPVLISDLAIDYTLLGTLVGLYLLPGVVFSLPGGLLGQRFGDKRIAVFGLALMAIGGVWVGASGSFASAAAGRLLSGVGGVLLNIHLTKMTTDWFAGREIVLAMALLLSSWPIGIGIALVLLPPIATATSGSTALATTALASALPLIVMLAAYRAPADLAVSPASWRFRLSRAEWKRCRCCPARYGACTMSPLFSFSPSARRS
jgi:MFS family permease